MNSYFELGLLAEYRVTALREEASRDRRAKDATWSPKTPIRLRLAEQSDRAALVAFLARLSPATLHARYLSARPQLSTEAADREARRLLDDAACHVVVVAEDGAHIRGVGEFVAEADTAELALVVEDAFQNRGIGKLLYRQLAQLARQRCLTAFTGDVHYDNHRVLAFMRRNRPAVQLRPDLASIRFTLPVRANG
jgi:GNAT superfamily N-acetyltransferase